MKSDLPKVLHLLGGKPLISHVIDNVKAAGIYDIIVVVGYGSEQVIHLLPEGVSTVRQIEQKGTGHAVMQAAEALEGYNGYLYVACGDVPLLQPGIIRKMMDEARRSTVKAVVLSMNPVNPAGYGRIIRDNNGDLLRIVEEKDATETEKRINEVNTGTYVFNKDSLFKGLITVTTENAQGEYYLPDVFRYIREVGGVTRIVRLENPMEGSGINSREDLIMLEQYLSGVKLEVDRI